MKYTSAIVVLSNYFSAYLYFTYSEVNAINTNDYRDFDKNGVKNGCNSLVAYKIILHTYWTREIFPKHYPDWKPPAQWSKTLGRTHDASFNLFSIGKVATSGVKIFVETGRSDNLEAQSTTGTFNEFSVPAIYSGIGYNEANFFADSNHTLVSFITKITPSPDWFIGIDSFELRVNDSWVDKIRLELRPLDGGTDNGFTFTAPNWPTDPTGVIYRITSGYPAHQAGSFFYPQMKQLPPIASVTFIKLSEYELLKTFHNTEDDTRFESIKSATLLTGKESPIIPNNELSAYIEEERQAEGKLKQSQLNEKDQMRTKLLAKINLSIHKVSREIQFLTFQMLHKSDLINSSTIFEFDKNKTESIAKNKNIVLKKKRLMQPLKDCRVGTWSKWSACNKTCGVGEMQRYRKVIRHAKHGGRPCPPLKEAKWCKLERDCISDYF